MGQPIISVEDLGKKYRLLHQAERPRYKALRDVIADNVRRLFRPRESAEVEEFWALKNVSFAINEGEVVGIIGRNGAGKSTLLKVLSQIAEPTTGRVRLRGRVASLLEVGTGFHPELTGRENIYLNGAILGMTGSEIKRKFDEIVAFAEVERFLDTPVKRYSSGMYMRLAFGVAAHLEPEILLVDEVLAVGDLAFQKKCLGKMRNVAHEGRTVLLVSHNMSAIASLCKRAIVLEHGCLQYTGDVPTAVQRYIGDSIAGNEVELQSGATARRGSGEVRFTKVALVSRDQYLTPSTALTFRLHLTGTRVSQMLVALIIRTDTGIQVYHVHHLFPEPQESAGDLRIDCHLPRLSLFPGRYLVSLWLGYNAYHEIDFVPDAQSFDVNQEYASECGFDVSWQHGIVDIPAEWDVTSTIHNAAESHLVPQ